MKKSISPQSFSSDTNQGMDLSVVSIATEPTASFREYVLGDAENELRRLVSQSRLIGDITEQVMLRAGIGPGMNVLDCGCGVGDV